MRAYPNYSIDELFEKKLFLQIPFFLFRYEKEYDRMEKDEKMLDELKAVYRDIEKRLDTLVLEEDQEKNIYGLVDKFTERMLMDMYRKVAGKLAENHLQQHAKRHKTIFLLLVTVHTPAIFLAISMQ